MEWALKLPSRFFTPEQLYCHATHKSFQHGGTVLAYHVLPPDPRESSEPRDSATSFVSEPAQQHWLLRTARHADTLAAAHSQTHRQGVAHSATLSAVYAVTAASGPSSKVVQGRPTLTRPKKGQLPQGQATVPAPAVEATRLCFRVKCATTTAPTTHTSNVQGH